MKIGFKDKNGVDLELGQLVMTSDSERCPLTGTIVVMDTEMVGGRVKYAFRSNYDTFINNQEDASKLIVVYPSFLHGEPYWYGEPSNDVVVPETASTASSEYERYLDI